MSDPKVVYHRYSCPNFSYDAYPELLFEDYPIPKPIETLRYNGGKWELITSSTEVGFAIQSISQDLTKLWVEKYSQENTLRVCQDVKNEIEVLETFKSNNNATLFDGKTQGREINFAVEDWGVVLVYRSKDERLWFRNIFDNINHEETEKYLFESKGNWVLVKKALKIDRGSWSGFKEDDSIFEVELLGRDRVLSILRSNNVQVPIDLRTFKPEELPSLGIVELNSAVSRKKPFEQLRTNPHPQEGMKKGFKALTEKDKALLYLLQQYDEWKEEQKKATNKKRFNENDWLNSFDDWPSKARSIFDKYADENLSESDELSKLLDNARKIQSRKTNNGNQKTK
jgi:hypothetical protein